MIALVASPANASRRETGFSFVELLATLAIVALLASIAIPLAQTTVKRSKEMELRRALRDVRMAIDAYKRASTDGFIAVLPGQSGYPPSLTDLTAGVENAKVPGKKLYFLRRLPRDPFFADTTVPAADSWGVRSFDSPPDNPRTGDDVFDVYSTSTQLGLNGLAYKEW
ncbi:type II secretion system protein [Chitinimonas sp. BJYL2]|uniref:type II secretion system protein n=1 Tax=Chitinimonas sp. BJYL2 TaxID=2976696 RepID=UPI0022B54F14|nr:type II secretion system protein [Chitinimonas sp. BJYL2]